MLVTDEAFRYFVEHDHASEMLEAKIQDLTLANIKCQDTSKSEFNTIAYSGLMGFIVGALSIAIILH